MSNLEANKAIPFLSISLFKVTVKNPNALKDELESFVKFALAQIEDQKRGTVYTIKEELDLPKENTGKIGKALGFFGMTFCINKYPGWLKATDSDVQSKVYEQTYYDTNNHVIIFVFHDSHLAVTTTDSRLDKKMYELLPAYTPKKNAGIFQVVPVGWDELQKALAHGATKGMVMESVEGPDDSRADVRNTTGQNLKYTIRSWDRLMTITVIVSEFHRFNKEQPRVGISKRQGKIWTSKPKDLAGLGEHISALFNLLADPDWGKGNLTVQQLGAEDAGGEKFEIPAKSISASQLKDAIELALFRLIPDIRYATSNPNLISDEDSDSQTNFFELLWERYGYFEVINTNGNEASVKAFYDDVPIATLRVVPLIKNRQVEWMVSVIDDHQKADSEEMIVLDKLLEGVKYRVHALYGSGHVVKGDDVLYIKSDPVVFAGWKWSKFNSFEIGKEFPTKPGLSNKSTENQTDYDAIGDVNDKSLFAFVIKNIDSIYQVSKSLLICDHGSGEIADFIHFDPEDNWISLVHVKKSPSIEPTRRASIPAYYEVLGQAIKSLHYVSRKLLCDRLLARMKDRHRQGKKLVVMAKGVPEIDLSDPESIVGYLLKPKKLPNYRIVVVQPHLRKEYWNKKVDTNNNLIDRTKTFDQLLTYINGNHEMCFDEKAELHIISEDDL